MVAYRIGWWYALLMMGLLPGLPTGPADQN
jgi:hypothetical protein